MDGTVEKDSLLDSGDHGAGYYLYGTGHIKIVKSWAILASDKENILKAMRCDKQSLCTFSLQEGICGHRASMDNFKVLRQLGAEKMTYTLKDRVRRILGCGRELEGLNTRFRLQHKIGECPAGINTQNELSSIMILIHG